MHKCFSADPKAASRRTTGNMTCSSVTRVEEPVNPVTNCSFSYTVVISGVVAQPLQLERLHEDANATVNVKAHAASAGELCCC